MLHKLTKIKVIVNEIWRVFKIFDSVIADEVLSLYLLGFFFLSVWNINQIIYLLMVDLKSTCI